MSSYSFPSLFQLKAIEAEFPESLVSDSNHRVSRPKTRLRHRSRNSDMIKTLRVHSSACRNGISSRNFRHRNSLHIFVSLISLVNLFFPSFSPKCVWACSKVSLVFPNYPKKFPISKGVWSTLIVSSTLSLLISGDYRCLKFVIWMQAMKSEIHLY